MTEEHQNIRQEPDNSRQRTGGTKSRRPIRVYEYILVVILVLLPIANLIFIPLAILYCLYCRRPGSGTLLTLTLIFGFIGIQLYYPNWLDWLRGGDEIRAREAQVKSNLHNIQIALELYAVDHQGTYPTDIQTLREEGYIEGFPTNPFTQAPMKEIAFGSSPFEGEFTYVPFLKDGHVLGFYLLGYGDKNKPGYDVDGDAVGDHVIIILASGVPNSGIHRAPRESSEVPMESGEEWPPLKDLLRAQRENGQAQSAAEPENIK